MGTICGEITKFLEKTAPLRLAEEWDNVGLMVGSLKQEINRVLVCLDATPAVIGEAVEKNVDLIISHHPFIFKGLKRINEEDEKGGSIHKLIKNNIGVYSAHTNLDAADEGVNAQLAALLGLKDIVNLKDYKAEKLYKMVVFVPEESVDSVRDAMSRAGAGWIGNYSDCSFMAAGTGTFRPLKGTNPYIGSEGKLEKVKEWRIETVVPTDRLKAVVDSMLDAHPYEEVAYDIYSLELKGKAYGFGKVGLLERPQALDSFIPFIKKALNVKDLRVIGKDGRMVKKVAVFCGSFDGDLGAVADKKADVLVTGDIKYHTALDIVEKGMCVIDAGHFNTERIIVPGLVELLKRRFSGLEVLSSNVEKDPFEYC
ncbi:MAG: Nif3-like dinuclear metal center hexameric protein [Clostridiales bacterium]|jgi:dinuclear metal center YbgI/SA1388 family protein|nr:Nif3-like dinuclear metal center hexameric protein [Eubacteriales bacterium]MDH7565302.1 Nif3-like dinuclear metal center hexameric protein [Clostridiales bacterium]